MAFKVEFVDFKFENDFFFFSDNELGDYLYKKIKEKRTELKNTNIEKLEGNKDFYVNYMRWQKTSLELYGKCKYTSFEEYIQGYIDDLTRLIVSMKFLIPFFEKEIDIKHFYSFIEYDKLCLIIAYNFMNYIKTEYTGVNGINGSVVYINSYLKAIENIEKLQGKKYKCKINIGYDQRYDIDLLKKDFLEHIEKSRYKGLDVNKTWLTLSMIYNDDKFSEKVSQMNEEEIDDLFFDIYENFESYFKQLPSYGIESVSTAEIENTIENIKEDIKKGNLTLEEYKHKKHQLEKLNMVFNEIKPKAIQKGIGAFNRFNVYYYANGMVAIDKIEYGARLFIMPITTYKYIIENNINSLRVIGKLDGVKAFKHDERIDWLSKAKEIIKNGLDFSSIEDIQISEEIMTWEFNYTEDDISKLNEIMEEIKNSESYTEEEKQNKLNKLDDKKNKKELKKKKAKEIDNFLINSEPKADLDRKDEREIIELETELSSTLGYEKSFEELFEYEQNRDKKIKRSVAVSKYGKDRTMDANGFYHCEMCNTEYPQEERSRLDFHHFVPIADGGPDTIYNGLCLCTECHRIIHFEQERISPKTKIKILGIIENHIKNENPELLGEFYNYKKQYFSTFNDIIYDKRKEIKQQLLDEGFIEEQNVDIISEEIDKRIESFEKRLEEEYQMDPKKYDENFGINWNDNREFKK